MNPRREGYPGIPRGAQRHHKGPGKFKREAGEDSSSVVPCEKDPTGLLLALRMEGARSSGTQDNSRDRKCKEVDASLEPPRGTQPRRVPQQLDGGPVSAISDFGPPEV